MNEGRKERWKGEGRKERRKRGRKEKCEVWMLVSLVEVNISQCVCVLLGHQVTHLKYIYF